MLVGMHSAYLLASALGRQDASFGGKRKYIAEEIIYKYYPRSRVQQKTVYMLMEEIGVDNESGK